MITAVLPVSRLTHLDRVLDTLEKQTYKPDSLLVVYDGPDGGYVEVRNKIVGLSIDNILCVPAEGTLRSEKIIPRRMNIAKIHNQAGTLIEDADWVFSIEDDGLLPPDALEKLYQLTHKKNVGMVTGVELGRWGQRYVGAWNVDKPDGPARITSLANKTSEGGVEELDACGLYCALIRADEYKAHTFYATNGLGPDVNLGLHLKKLEFNNYIDWSIHVTHITNDGEIEATSPSKVVRGTRVHGNVWQYS